MKRNTYDSEYEGQKEFCEDFLKLINPDLELEDILDDYNDGVLNGNLLEFKLSISDINKVLFQAIKYASARRIKGKPLPENLILIDLNRTIAYIFKSEDYLSDIEQVYIGAVSKDNEGFIGGNPVKVIPYRENATKTYELADILKSNNFTKINIDENCIVGWGERYYRENPKASKSAFIGDEEGKVKIIGEIRSPDYFKEYINPYPYESNE